MDKAKVEGALYALAIGDAMGAPTELRTQQQIVRDFDGWVTTFQPSPSDTFASGYEPGTVTDDFSMSYYLIQEILKAGTFNEEVGKQSIISWGEDEIYFDKFAGPTTRAAIENMKQGLPTDVDPWGLINYSNYATNGGAMKTVPVALLANGDWQKALQYTLALCLPTHYNSNAMAGAAAIACAATEALNEGTTIDRIVEAGIWGASMGKQYGYEQDHISIGPDLAFLIESAAAIGENARDFEDLLMQLDRKIGTTFQVVQSVPCVFGILKGVQGDLMQGIYAGVNIGGDTDTIAAMVGGILGAYHGVTAVDSQLMAQVVKANPSLDILSKIEAFTDFLVDIEETNLMKS